MKTILIHQDDIHNKFWIAEYNKSTKIVTTKWGRIGTKGQSKTKPFPTDYQAESWISSATYKKQEKGYVNQYDYKPITDHTLQKLATIAAIIGTQNKCQDPQWVEIDLNNKSYKKIDENRLQHPECYPGLRLRIETKKSYKDEIGDDHTFFNLIFCSDGCFRSNYSGSFITTANTIKKIEKDDPIYPLVLKLEKAVGLILS